VLAVGFIANLLIRPVPEKYHQPAANAEPTPEGSVAR
jgi:hypothetical protein